MKNSLYLISNEKIFQNNENLANASEMSAKYVKKKKKKNQRNVAENQ